MSFFVMKNECRQTFDVYITHRVKNNSIPRVVAVFPLMFIINDSRKNGLHFCLLCGNWLNNLTATWHLTCRLWVCISMPRDYRHKYSWPDVWTQLVTDWVLVNLVNFYNCFHHDLMTQHVEGKKLLKKWHFFFGGLIWFGIVTKDITQ